MILIVTKAGDVHADHVESLLRARHAEVVRFDPGDFPGQARIVLEHAHGQVRTLLHTRGTTIDLADVRVGWYRRPSPARASARIEDPAMRAYVELESTLFVDGVWEALDCAWLPGLPADLRRADHKLRQLKRAAQVGFTIPATLMTNDGEELVRFYEAHDGQLISKLPSPAVYWVEPRVAVRYTQVVTRGDLGHLSRLRHAPVIFQPRIAKDVELRVTIVGSQVFAAEIHSQNNARTAIDSRESFERTPHAVHALPELVAARCRELTRQLGLRYSTIDLILTPDGHYVFLELNPSGQYLWIEERTGLPISEALVDFLMKADDDDDRDDRALAG